MTRERQPVLRGPIGWLGFTAMARVGWRIAVAAVLVLQGCGGGDISSTGSDASQAPAVCGAVDSSAAKAAVFVAAQGNDASGCGATTQSACKTVQQGIHQCSASDCAVFVRHGLYPTTATINLRDGVSVYGACRFDGEPARGYRTLIQGDQAAGQAVIRADGIKSPTLVRGLVVLGTDEIQAKGSPPSTASIAVFVIDSVGLTLSDSILIGGFGSLGRDGVQRTAEPGGDGLPPPTKTSGGPGGAACPSNPPPNNDAGRGGKGADLNKIFTTHHGGGIYAYCANNNEFSGLTGPYGDSGQSTGTARGGDGGEPGTEGCFCNGNSPGSGPDAPRGGDGICAPASGTAASVWGTLTRQGWVPSESSTGLAGEFGAGGGGGGGGGFSAHYSDNQFDIDGYPGGGGGGGGCGGLGGSGGQQGGASIVLVLANSIIADVAQRNVLIPGPGGDGGRGGPGGPGGKGGQGHAGVPGFDKAQIACEGNLNGHMAAPGSGGRGGNGGDGGGGGGGSAGNGGPSIGIARVQDAPVPVLPNNIYAPLPGAPGSRGAGGQNSTCHGGDGIGGLPGGAITMLDFDRLPESVPSAGQQPAPRQGNGSAERGATSLRSRP